jgi:hypothetical protein
MRSLRILAGLVAAVSLSAVPAASSASVRGSASAAALPAYADAIRADQPRAYWRLGEAAGATTAVDSSGNGFTGTYRGGVSPGADSALYDDGDGSASFPGTADGQDVLIPDNSGLDFGTQTDFSVEAWINTTANGGEAIIGKRDDTAPGWKITVSADPGYVGRVRTLFAGGGVPQVAYGPSVRVDDGVWHHVVAIFDRGAVTRIWVDRAESITSAPSHATMSSKAPLEIGDSAADPAFAGQIDDVAVYGYALPKARILAHYDAARYQPPTFADEVGSDEQDGYWRLGDAAGSAVVADATGNGAGGTPQNGVALGVAGALAEDSDTAAHFNGTGAAIDMGNRFDYGTGDFSVAGWIRTTSAGEEAIAGKSAGSGPRWYLSVTSDVNKVGRLRAVINDGTTEITAYGPPIVVNDGQWHFVAAVFDRQNGVSVDVDGAEAQTRGATPGSVSNAAPFRIGSEPAHPSFNGDIDEMALYAYALGADRIAAQAAAGVEPAPLPVLAPEQLNEQADAPPYDTGDETYDPVDFGGFDPEVDGGDSSPAGSMVDDGTTTGTGTGTTTDGGAVPGGGASPGDTTVLVNPMSVRRASTDSTCASDRQVCVYKHFDNRVIFRNLQGWWTIYTKCQGPGVLGGTKTVGPGYFAVVKRRYDGEVIVNDVRGLEYGTDANATNGYGKGGLGSFGFHEARGPDTQANLLNPGGAGPTDPSGNAWSVDGRVCAADANGFGVSGASASSATTNAAHTRGYFSVNVDIGDHWAARLIRIRYVYVFQPKLVQAWMKITSCFDASACNSLGPGFPFVKEPKIAATLRNPHDSKPFYNRQAIFTRAKKLIGECVHTHDDWDPTIGLNDAPAFHSQCSNDLRARARFDYGTDSSGTNGGCDTKPCFNIMMLAYPVSGSAALPPARVAKVWERGGYGLDRWAELAQSSRHHPFNTQDQSSIDHVAWADNCHTDTSKGAPPAWEALRRWESEGSRYDPATGTTSAEYDEATVFFHGWEGGRGYTDCEPLSRKMWRQSFGVYAQYSIAKGWN